MSASLPTACCALIVSLATVGLVASNAAIAQDYPSRLVRMITGGSQGGPIDVASRVVAQRLAEIWGQPVIVENRVGASEIIAGEAVAKAKPDGYTLLLVGGALTLTPALYPKLPYDPEKSFTPITLLMQSPMALVISSRAAQSSLDELLAAARQRPGQVAWASGGIGTNNHFAGEQLALITGIKVIHAPYKGSAPAATAVIAGEAAYGIVALTSALGNAKAGTLRLIALTSEKRSVLAPGVPALPELGVTGVDGAVRAGLAGPAGLPAAVVARVNADVNRVLAEPAVRDRFATLGMEPTGSSPEEYDAFNRRTTAQMRAIAQQANIKVE